MAASGSGKESDNVSSATADLSVKKGFELIGMVCKNGVFNTALVYSDVSTLRTGQNGNISKSATKTNTVNSGSSATTGTPRRTSSLDSMVDGKNVANVSTANLTRNAMNGLISGRTLRFDRAGSTDSVAVSSGGSDHGGSDTCQSSSSDTTSVSEPCSPEAGPESTSRPGTPQPMPPIPPSLAEDDPHQHHHRHHTRVTSHHNHNRSLIELEERVQDQMSAIGDAIYRSLSERAEAADKARVAVASCEQSRKTTTEVATIASPSSSSSSSDTASADAKNKDAREPFWCSSSQDGALPTGSKTGSSSVATGNDDARLPEAPMDDSRTAVERFLDAARPEMDKAEESESRTELEVTVTKETAPTTTKRKCAVGAAPEVVSDAKRIKVEPAEEDDEASCSASMAPVAVLPPPEGGCKWHACQQDVPSDRLVEHMKSCHVDSQMENETFVCLWVGCKVYNRPSCSVSWLQRHILSHGGNKPLKCIVEGCQHRFASQSALERHVNSHFNSTQSNSASLAGGAGSSCAGGKTGRSKEDTPTKLIKKRKLRYRRRCWAVKTEDYFDAGVMEHVRHNLMEMERKSSLDTIGASRLVNFQSNVIARRIEESGKVKLLLHWTPEDVFPDSWISECQLGLNSSRSMPLSLLPRDTICKLDPSLESHSRVKRRRK